MTHSAPAPTPRSVPPPRPAGLSRPARRTLLVVHVVASAGWLGLTVGLLALALTGVLGDQAARRTTYGAMAVLSDWPLLPFALVTLVSGLVLSLGTHWGLARYRWVWVKFWLTLAATLATVLVLRPELGHAAARAAAGHPVDGTQLLFPPSVSLSLYVFMTALSVLKPWGQTRWGRQARESARATRKAAKPLATGPSHRAA